MKLKSKNKIYCVVGIGYHSFDKLIPALTKSGKKVVGFVSRSSKKINPKYRRFTNIDMAIKILPRETVFLISTPPETHYFFINKLIKNKRDIIIEKPILTSNSQIYILKKVFLKDRSNYLIKEAFMYRHSLMFKKSLSFFKSNLRDVRSVNCYFIIPSIPENSFRNLIKIESSCLYDIGCYIFDYFLSFNLALKNFQILNVKLNNKKITSLNFSFNMHNIVVNSNIGIGGVYKNSIVIKNIHGKNIEFNNLFYGRPGNKTIRMGDDEDIFYDKNSFIQMFKEKNQILIFNKKKNYFRIKKVHEILEKFKQQLKYYDKNKQFT